VGARAWNRVGTLVHSDLKALATVGLSTLSRLQWSDPVGSARGGCDTVTTLADGRELIYFDDSEPYLSGARSRDEVDQRPLDARLGVGTMRLDALTGEWVSIADHRHDRTFLPPAGECPLCPAGGGTMASEIPAHEYDVVVFENLFPSFATGPAPAPTGTPVNPLRVHAPASGRCEVVCFTNDHDASFSFLTPARARTVVDVWADRTRERSKLEDVEHVFCLPRQHFAQLPTQTRKATPLSSA
jgi:UDPglucose--hexose-1-phosphate uridylyltransferase